MIERISIPSVLITAFLLISSCSGNKEKDHNTVSETVNPAFSSHIKTAKTEINKLEKEMTLTGKVISDPDKTIHYIPLISGIIDRTYFSIGDYVQKGQTLIDIRSTELSALYTEQISLESEVKITERELRSAQSMYEDNMLSERDLLEAQSKVIQSQTHLNKIKSDIALIGSHKMNGVFSIKAPMSGYIINKNVSSGTPISTDSDPLFTIADLSTVWITANVYASHLAFVREDMEANITTLSYPNEVFTGKINTLSQVFDPEDKALKARIVLPNMNLKLKPEMSVVIRLKDNTQNTAVTIQSEAVIFDNNTYYVIVSKGNNSFEIREIIPYDRNSRITYISSGLEEDEEVVIKNHLLIYSELKGV